jgi:hypothetical protein
MTEKRGTTEKILTGVGYLNGRVNCMLNTREGYIMIPNSLVLRKPALIQLYQGKASDGDGDGSLNEGWQKTIMIMVEVLGQRFDCEQLNW